MGEKGNAEVLGHLKAMAQQQEPGLRDRVMQMLNDYQTVRAVTASDKDEDKDEDGNTESGPQAPQA